MHMMHDAHPHAFISSIASAMGSLWVLWVVVVQAVGLQRLSKSKQGREIFKWIKFWCSFYTRTRSDPITGKQRVPSVPAFKATMSNQPRSCSF